MQVDIVQDHVKSKKHTKAVEEKKERYPEIMKLMTEAGAADQEESDRPNHGDRLQYRYGM
jgi:hypothetical protein